MNNNFSNKLIELRKKKGLSQEELAEKLGLSRQAISKWERGESYPDLDNIIQLAKLYEISFNELFSVNEEKEEIIEEVEVENDYPNYCGFIALIFGVIDVIITTLLATVVPEVIIIFSCITIIVGGIGIYISHQHHNGGKTISRSAVILGVISILYIFFIISH